MKHTIYKGFWAWNYEKEENWLNEMSAKGLQLVNVGFCKYVFAEGEKGEFTYRLELLDNLPSHAESVVYIHFLEEMGIEHLASYFRWVYLRKKSVEGRFDLYSDINSKIKHHKRILMLLLGMSPLQVWAFLTNLCSYLTLGTKVNLFFAIICFLVSTLLGKGIYTLARKIKQLNKEKSVRE